MKKKLILLIFLSFNFYVNSANLLILTHNVNCTNNCEKNYKFPRCAKCLTEDDQFICIKCDEKRDLFYTAKSPIVCTGCLNSATIYCKRCNNKNCFICLTCVKNNYNLLTAKKYNEKIFIFFNFQLQ